jgi:hypothetical protein
VGFAFSAILVSGSLSGVSAGALTTPPHHGVATSGSARLLAAARSVFAANARRRAEPQPVGVAPAGPQRVSASEAEVSSTSVTDPRGDTARAGADVTEVGVTLTATSLRMTATIPGSLDPKVDPLWSLGNSALIWSIDQGGDGIIEKLAVLVAGTHGRLLSGVVKNTNSSALLCAGNATADTGRFAMMVPTACLGNPRRVAVGVEMAYDIFSGVTGGFVDFAPDDGLIGPVARASTNPRTSGGFTLDAHGALHAFSVGGAPKPVTGGPTFAGPVARGVAITPDGGHGYVLDEYGALHPFAVGRNEGAPATFGAASWPRKDVARGVALRPDGTGGLVVDHFGGLHPFGLGDNRPAPKLFGAPSWPGVDMARGIAVLPDGSGGFELDAFGGLHWFSIGTARAAPQLFGVASFARRDDARGITLMPDGSGGFVVDRSGGLHWFSIGSRRSQPNLTGAPSWPGTDTARGVAVVTSLLGWPAPPTTPVAP